MACFLIPMGLGIVTTLLARFLPKRWNVGWLNAILWGAVAMLAVEHVAHGEVIPYPPFLTAGILDVLPEMISVGVPMAAFSAALWASLVVANEYMAKNTGMIKPGIRSRLGGC